jgi:hypothetical protein
MLRALQLALEPLGIDFYIVCSVCDAALPIDREVVVRHYTFVHNRSP